MTGTDNPRPMTVRLPGFLHKEPIGLGDVVKRATSRLGIKACGGCQARGDALNRRVVIGRR